MGHKVLQQLRAVLRPMRIRAAGSKILLFLFMKQRFLRSGGKWHVLGLPTIIFIQNNQFNKKEEERKKQVEEGKEREYQVG